jgi:hypothetical protein
LKLGVTKQAVAERKRRLEEEGFTRSFYFWNISPRFECTKRVLIKTEKGPKQINRITHILHRFNPVVVFFRTEPEEFFEGKAASLLFNNEKEEDQLRAELEQIGISDVSIEFVLFSRLLGEKCDITAKTPQQVEDIARDVAQHLSSEASVHAVLYERRERPVDQFDLIVIRDERFQPKADSYERRIRETLLDYHFTNLRWFMSSKDKWLKNMKIIYARDETLRKRMQRKIDSIKS